MSESNGGSHVRILINGVDYTTGRTLCDPLDESTLSNAIQSGLHRNADELRNLTRVSAAGTTFRGEMERQRTPDLGVPAWQGGPSWSLQTIPSRRR
jgi:hypothetical protein